MGTEPAGGTGTKDVGDGDAHLISAVRGGDAELVRTLLRDHGNFGDRDRAFALAVRSYRGHIAQLLLQNGADPSQCAPDELLPLREAVESGSPALVDALLHGSIRGRHPESELQDMRDLARHWHEAGVENEMRRRTGSQDAATRTRLQEDQYDSIEEFTLGGMRVRDGHGAILTHLEELLGIRTSFEGLMDRALPHARQDHPAWGSATMQLANRRDQATWTAAEALRTHPDPAHRLFGAEVLRLTHLFDDSDEDAYAVPALDVFIHWSGEETDVAVLTEVLVALAEHCDLRAEAALLPYTVHPDARVRRAVVGGFSDLGSPPAFSGDARAALLRLMADPDARVRKAACHNVAGGRDHDPVFAEAMAALLDDPDRLVRLSAVYGLALHNDERCVEAARLLGPARPGSEEEEGYLDAVWRYEWRRDGR
ncbi:HEAT repeat domain-containing protein [Streptomyces sp. NPDC051582]|uniref:HEAT repeat domain-containing protein n=1 Tax=Streptomyces sp. NPDC051582 TaxID=3155167 RepID=UPI00341E47D2